MTRSFAARMWRGFTLIEMAIVLAVVGFFISAGIQVAAASRTGVGVSLTNKRLDNIQKALQLYVTAYGCLPCPTDGSLASTTANAGHALASGATYVTATVHCTATVCAAAGTTANGVVPWLDLGLSEEDITDGWKSRIRYAVHAGVACGSPSGVQDVNGMARCTLATFPAGGLTINDLDAGTALTTAAAYVLVSNGPDLSFGLAAVTGTPLPNRFAQAAGGQFENSNSDVVFSTGSVATIETTAHFDDILRFATAPQMIVACGIGACGNPS